MPFGGLLTAALIGGGASIGSGLLGYFGSQNAASAQTQALQQAMSTVQNIEKPFVGLGTNAANQLSNLYGLNGGSPNAGWQQFVNSPDYQWAFGQGTNATQNVLASQGNLLSGGGLAALTNYGQGLASQQFGNYFNRLMQMTQLGANAGSATASSLAGLQSGVGTAQAQGILGGTNALSSGLTGISNAANSFIGNNMLYSLLSKSPAFGGGNAGSAFAAPGNGTGGFGPAIGG